jgi:hypothetical protein
MSISDTVPKQDNGSDRIAFLAGLAIITEERTADADPWYYIYTVCNAKEPQELKTVILALREKAIFQGPSESFFKH